MKMDKTKFGLRGPVQNVQIVTAQLEEHDGQITEKPSFSYTITFNKQGHVIEHVVQNPDGSAWSSVNEYSGSGNLLMTRAFDPKGALNRSAGVLAGQCDVQAHSYL